MQLGIEFRNAGMEAARQHADKVYHAWSERAYQILIEYLQYRSYGSTFLTEDLREYAVKQGLPEPPSLRAWGSVVMRAAKAGVIQKIGYRSVDNPKAHMAIAAVWKNFYKNS